MAVNPFNEPPTFGQLSRGMNAERQAREQDFRTQLGKQKQNPVLENPLNRPAAWEGQLTPRIRPFAAAAQGPTQTGATADTTGVPQDWRGQTGISNPPPINNAMGGTGREGVVLPDSGYNYRGEKSYVSPYSSGPGAGNTIEVNPSKDLLYSRDGQTTGQLTAQGIQDKYQTPGTTARITQGNVTDAQGNTMAQNGRVTPFTPADPVRTASNTTNPVNGGFGSRDEWMQARNSLQQQHPEVFQAGTPKNLDFSDYAQQHGEPAAHAYMQTAYPATASVAPTPSPAPDSAASAAQSTPATNRVNAFPASKQPPGTQG